jgi:hypothetical protein
LLGGEPENGKGTEPLPGGGGKVHQGTAKSNHWKNLAPRWIISPSVKVLPGKRRV